ncbi:MAG: hypothetical protein ABIJ96_00910 [Elusimicrobiota bacterium]
MTMTLYITACSKEKKRDRGDLPALERYDCERIRRVHADAAKQGAAFRVLSGKFLLLEADAPIPYYDKYLSEREVGFLVRLLARQLNDLKAAKVVFFRAPLSDDPGQLPYQDLIVAACYRADLAIEVATV